MNDKKWCMLFLIGSISILVTLAVTVIIIDPFFHYHAPLQGMSYTLENDRYQNNGILRNFKYNGLIIGDSLTSCYLTSELDNLMDVNSIKTPFLGATYREINDNIEVAINNNPDLKVVIRPLDYHLLEDDPARMAYEEYPDYLYDDVLLNDVEYLFNKQVLMYYTFNVLYNSIVGNPTTSFDAYFNYGTPCGKELVLNSYEKTNPVQEKEVTHLDRRNLEENVLEAVRAHPEVQFYYYLSPNNICWFDTLRREGKLKSTLLKEHEAIEILLDYPNLHLYSFFGNTDLICDLDCYSDRIHYSAEVNSQILQWISNGDYELSKENFVQYCRDEYDFYIHYDYDSLGTIIE